MAEEKETMENEASEETADSTTENLTENEATEAVDEKSELTRLAELAEENEDKYLRVQAELVNMRNRFQKERETLLRYRSQDLGKAILPALDNLERALAIEVSDEQGESLKKGIEMVMDSLLQGFKEVGITEIPAMGEAFDPNVHQAVQTLPVEEGQTSDQIVHVLQKGYILDDRVIRPAMVVVAQ